MSCSFKTILIPVDFSINTEVAIAKALDITDTEEAYFHLLYVQKQPPLLTLGKAAEQISVDQKLDQWKKSIEDYMPTITVQCWIERSSSVQHCIEKTALSLGVDLIVIGKNSTHSWLPVFTTVTPIKLAGATGITVLTVKPGALHNKIKTVVVPITDRLPRNKMTAIESLCKRGRLTVHLVTFVNGSTLPSDSSASTLLQVYQWLQNAIHCPVEYSVLHGYNNVKATLDYAKKVNADILLVYPDSETKMGWLNTHISDVLPTASGMQVLTVQPTLTSVVN